MESKGSRLGNGHAAEHGTSLPGTTCGRSSSEQSRGHLSCLLAYDLAPTTWYDRFLAADARHSHWMTSACPESGPLLSAPELTVSNRQHPLSPSRLSERCSCPSLSLLGVNSVACFTVVTFQVQDREWDAIWPRRCHSEYASSLACSAPPDEARTAGLAEDCQQPKSLFAAWSHDGPLVVGVDGI